MLKPKNIEVNEIKNWFWTFCWIRNNHQEETGFIRLDVRIADEAIKHRDQPPQKPLKTNNYFCRFYSLKNSERGLTVGFTDFKSAKSKTKLRTNLF